MTNDVDAIRAHYDAYNRARVAKLQDRAYQLERYALRLANGDMWDWDFETEAFATNHNLTDEQRAQAIEELVEAVRIRSYYYDDSTHSELTENDVIQLVDLALIPLLHGPDRMCTNCVRNRRPAFVLPAWAGPFCHEHFETGEGQ